MLVVRDLGFSSLVLFLFLFVPTIVFFFVRRKWRQSVARADEIKRLLVLASEEAARAELEASYGFVIEEPTVPRQLPFQCAVCFSPTSTRCARCKAVRYCSGKCQIIHWRQGHKEECRPFTQISNNQEEYAASGLSFESRGGHYAELVETFPEEPDFSSSSGSPLKSREKDGIEHPPYDNRDDGLSHADTIDGLQANNRVSSSSESTKNLLAKLNQMKVDCSDGEIHCGSSSSSGWTVDGSNDSSFSAASTPSSSFWEGTINSKQSREDGPDDFSQSSSSEAGDDGILDVQPSTHFPYNVAKDAVPPLHVHHIDAKTIISNGARPSTVVIKKPNDVVVLCKETSDNATKTQGMPSLRSEASSHKDNDRSTSRPLKSEHSSFSSGASSCYANSGNGKISKNVTNVRSLPLLGTERLNHRANEMSRASHVPKSKEVDLASSRASDPDKSSIVQKPTISCSKAGKVDSNCGANSSFASQSPNSDRSLKISSMKVNDQIRSSSLSHHNQSGKVGNEMDGRYKGLFPYEHFVKLYNCNKVELRPCGLINCGNSCYANAVLQCLAFTPPLTAYLLEGLHSKACKKKEWCFTCEFETLIRKAKAGNSPLSPIGILSQIQNIGSHLAHGREEDAHEFLRYAIDTMQSVCLKEAGIDSSDSLEETTLIGLTFGGYLRSKVKCMRCGGKSECHEKMMDLTVEIEGDIDTLDDALRKFTGTEILDGENKYQCSRCNSYQRAKKRLTILEAPNILTVALKRFQSGKFGKLNKTIRFPEILDLAPCMSGTSDKSPIYRLYGVVVHLDVMNAAFSGHYICYVKNNQNQWFKIDDSMVKPVGIGRVLAEGAYMLLYARCSPRASRSMRSSIIPRDPRKLKNPSFKLRSSHLLGREGDALAPDRLNIQDNVKPLHKPIYEEDSFSDNSSSVCFSEDCSSSTDSTRGGSSSADEFLDQIFGNLGRNWNNHWRNSSDSDTSSSSSSASSPSPMFSRHSPLADLDRYSSGYNPETSGSRINIAESSATDGRGLGAMEGGGKGSGVPFLYSSKSTNEQSRKLGSRSSSSSCREADSDRLLKKVNRPFDDIKSGISFRRSTRERT